MNTKIYLKRLSKLIAVFALMVAFVFIATNSLAQVAINTDNSAPHASAMLDVKSTTSGMLMPRMTQAQRTAIASPSAGLVVYQTNGDAGYYYYDGAIWQKVGRAADNYWLPNGSDIYFSSGRVAIGINDPFMYGLHVRNYVAGQGAVRGVDGTGVYEYAEGQLGFLNVPSNPAGLPVNVNNIGVYGLIPGVGANGASIYGWNKDAGNNLNYGGIFVTDGAASSGATNYGIYSRAINATTNYAGFFNGRVVVEGHPSTAGNDWGGIVFRSEVKHNLTSDTYAIFCKSVPTDGYGIGLRSEGGWYGIQGSGNGGAYTGTTYGVYGQATGSAGTRIGVYGTAAGGTTNWAGYFVGSAYVSNNLRIGTTTQATGYALSVNGKIIATEVRVEAFSNWPDYVFADDYSLMSLDKLEQSINENRHLPGIPSAKEVSESGFDLGDMQRRLLEKVEELTLYTIQQEKMIRDMQQEIKSLKSAE
jgi:hypothetical protein